MSQLPPPPQGLYIADGDESIFATFHAAHGPARAEAVLICPPFGWEDMCSYRGRREWACLLAAAGFPVLRIDFPGSGDSSGGPRDPERLRAWTDAVGASARWLSSTSGARRILAIGIGLGGAIAYRALSFGAPIDDLVLWGVSSRGRRHVRELRAFSYMESSHVEQETATPPTIEEAGDNALVVAGYVMSEDTQRELNELDLAEPDCERLASARVLMLERDGLAVDSRLKDSIERCGAEVTVASGDGYATMMMVELPHAVSAHQVFATVSSWLLSAEDPIEDDPGGGATPVSVDTDTSSGYADIAMPGGKRVRETPITISHPLGDFVGILTEPVGPALDLCAVWLNAGPQRRIGPNRMWVESARRWAMLGVRSVRIDLAAIGDTAGDSSALLDVRSYYTGTYLEQVRVVLDALEARGLPRRFLLGGLCAGAYWALSIANDDSRVSAVVALNPGYIVYDGGLSNAMGQGRRIVPMLLTRSTWSRVLRGQVTPSAHLIYIRTILAALGRAVLRVPSRVLSRKADASANEITQAFDRLQAQDQHALILFAGEERLYDQLLATGRLTGLERWPNVSVEHIAYAGNMHTMRPLSLQHEAQRAVDALLREELAAIAR